MVKSRKMYDRDFKLSGLTSFEVLNGNALVNERIQVKFIIFLKGPNRVFHGRSERTINIRI